MKTPARALGLAVTVALACGCGGGATGTRLTIDISSRGLPRASTTVAITLFDPNGVIGHLDVTPAPLPGQVTVSGLPARAESVRIGAIGSGGSQHELGSTTVVLLPNGAANAQIVMAPAPPGDEDGDGVPDAIDDCPAVPDPQQLDATGLPPGDACSGADLAGGDGAIVDLAAAIGSDAGTMPDLKSAPPMDMMRPASTCGTVSAALCDGFEGGSISAHWNNVLSGGTAGGTATLDTTRAYRGSSSLHLHNDAVTGANASDVELDETMVFFPHFFVRAFVYVPTGFDAADASIMLVEQNASPYQGVTLNLVNGTFATADSLSGGGVKVSSTPMPKDGWVCLEWEITLGSSANSNGTTALLVDGTTATNLAGNQPLYNATTPLSQFGLSLIGDPGTPARDLWMDELILDQNPIGCVK